MAEFCSNLLRICLFSVPLLLLTACGESEDTNTTSNGGGIGGGGGGTPPPSAFTVTRTDPPANAVGVQLVDPIVATFNSPIDPTTVNANSFRVSDDAGTSVAGIISTSGNTASFTPAPNALVKSNSYRSTLTTAIKDSSGNALPTDFIWNFATTTDAWTPTAVTNSTASPRFGHTTMWTGTEMIVWGGVGSLGMTSTGARFDLNNVGTDPWSSTTTTAAPLSRTDHTAIWTGTTMIVWGGDTVSLGLTNTGGRYIPSAAGGSWMATGNTSGLLGRRLHTAVWTGAPNSETIIWGGLTDIGVVRDGARYRPATNSWVAITLSGAPTARFDHTAVWTGSEMIIWGGDPGGGLGFTNSGGRYRLASGDWRSVSNLNAPTARTSHTAIWTGTEMIIWGGDDGFGARLDGARYNPATDTWTSMQNAPIARNGHKAIWTGTEMIVWGGEVSDNSGAAYNSAHDSWRSITIVGAPSGRTGHSAVWTGSEMIVWGGSDNAGATSTGGRYAP